MHKIKQKLSLFETFLKQKNYRFLSIVYSITSLVYVQLVTSLFSITTFALYNCSTNLKLLVYFFFLLFEFCLLTMEKGILFLGFNIWSKTICSLFFFAISITSIQNAKQLSQPTRQFLCFHRL